VALAFLFPGQGSQHAGMGATLLEDPEVAELARRCSEASGIDLCHQLVTADDGELTLTTNAQPALLFMGVALSLLLAREGVRPVAAAGHSVGEYTALCVAGAVPAEDAVRAVAERGKAMAEASPPGVSSMVAVLGLGPEAVESALAGLDEVWPANFNTPTQTVIGGTVAGLEQAATRLEAAGARRVLPLKVAAAFHTPLMRPAGARLRQVLDGLRWQEPSLPVVANVNGEAYRDGAGVPASLERQLSSPVRWSECVHRLQALGCDEFVEVGPKRALSGMLRELAPGASVSALATPVDVESYRAAGTSEGG
jgi:[acyl-carrier-protein] S-malonyltransferase